MIISDFFASFDEQLFKLQFSSGARIEFYESMKNLVENEVPTSAALKELYVVWSDNGRKKRSALAVICRDIISQMANGAPLSDAISRWAPYEEASLIAAGEQGGRESEAFDDCIRIIIAKQKIRGAIANATLYPAFLMIPLSGLLWVVSAKLVPAMARHSDPESWSGSAYALYLLASFFTGYGMVTLCTFMILAILFVYSLPRLRGGVRIFLDSCPLYSIYRMVHGSTFLLNLAVLMRAGVPLNAALQGLEKFANPWLKERIEGANYGVRQGSQLGTALENAGHNFPDKKAIQFIRILGERDGFSASISRYSERWLESSIKHISRFADVMKNGILILLGIIMALVVLGSQDMQSNITDRAERSTQSVQK